jgi:lysozyme
MHPRQQVSRTAIELIKRFEGYRRSAARLPDGRWTIGYGHTASAREGAQVSEADAEALLLYDLMGVAAAVNQLVYAELTQNQFDALCAFAFSIGAPAFRGSDVLKRVNEGAFTQAAFALELWRRAEFQGERIVIDALVRRRAAEKLLFLTPVAGAWRPAPSAILKPELDEAAVDTAPRETPAELLVSLEDTTVVDARGPESPVRAAAESVTARLEKLLATLEPRSEAAEPEPGEAEEPARDDEIAADEIVLPGEPPAEISWAPAPAELGGRILIDDTAPYEFVPPPVQPISAEPGDGVLGIVSLVILGLAFFAGGIFWALNAPPAPGPGPLTPVMVGWLAGVAGVAFLAAAVFVALRRMSRAAERRDRRRY